MHELAFAESVLQAVERECATHRATGVGRVRLRVGPYARIDKGSLAFCLEAISVNTMMEGAEIEIVGEQSVGEGSVRTEIVLEEIDLDVEEGDP